MKYLPFISILSMLMCTFSSAQDSIKTQLLDLRTPPSPAFVLLGIEPTSIDKPTTPRAVAASLITTVRQGGALEVAPYWLKSHPFLTFDEYYKAGIFQSMLQTFSTSFATMPRSSEGDSLGTRAGLGFRWLFAAGKPRDSLKMLRESLKKKQSEILDILKRQQSDTIDTKDSAEYARLQKDAQKIALAIQRENKLRVGFRLEMATALTANFINDDLKKIAFDRWGVWLTGAYLLDKPAVDFLAVARVMGNQKPVGSQNVFDFGFRLVASPGDFALSLEYIQRLEISATGETQVEEDATSTFYQKNTYRLAGNIEYKYNKDISAYLTFGRNYAGVNTINDPIIAQVGINLGFGEIPILKP